MPRGIYDRKTGPQPTPIKKLNPEDILDRVEILKSDLSGAIEEEQMHIDERRLEMEAHIERMKSLVALRERLVPQGDESSTILPTAAEA